MEYNYPLDPSWSIDEIVIVVELYNAVEKAYESGIKKDELMSIYNKFKSVVSSLSEEKQLDKEFKEVSGYSIYQVIKKARENDYIEM